MFEVKYLFLSAHFNILDQKNDMILVTGATGFLGAELVKQLTGLNLAVKAIARASATVPNMLKDNKLITWHNADINDAEDLADAFEDVTAVYHCAACVSFNPKDKETLFKVNVEGTENIVNLCLLNGIRLLHVSSVAALGHPKQNALITENDFWDYNPYASNYAISKYQGEMEVWRGIAEGLDAVIVNPSVIIGGQAGFAGSGAIFKLVQDGLRFYTDGSTGIVDVEDVAKCMILLMQSDLNAERYTISAENISYKDFFNKIASAFGSKGPHIKASPLMLNVAYVLSKIAAKITGKPAKITKEVARSSFNHSNYSNQKIITAIPFKFKPINKSIADTCHALTHK